MPDTNKNGTILQPNPYAGGRVPPTIIMPTELQNTGGNAPGSQGTGQNSLIIDDDVSLSGPSTGLNGTPQTNPPYQGGNVQPTTPGTDFIITVPGMMPGPGQLPSDNKFGWRQQGNDWFYFDPDSGALVKGWKEINNLWYYLDPATGIMATGWIKTGGLWYYLDPKDGHMLIDWNYIGGEWFYLETDNRNGQMVTGWKLHKGNWYFLFENGAMAHGGWVKVDEKWYCFRDPDGEMEASKIIPYKGKNYYVGEDGAMVVNTTGSQFTVVYNGVTYEVDEDGVCTNLIQDKIDRFVEIALNEKGTVEEKVNKTPYNTWFYNEAKSGDDYPWCATFVLWAGNAADILDGNIMPTLDVAHEGYYEGVRNLKGWYRSSGKLQENTYNPKKGDIIFFTWSHTGIVVSYDETTDRIYTIEGNTGDAVRLQMRSRDLVESFGINGGSTYGTIPAQESLNPSTDNNYR